MQQVQYLKITFSLRPETSRLDNNTLRITLDDLKQAVEKLKTPNILIFCFGMFALGSILDVVAFFMESPCSNEPVTQKPDSYEGQKPESSDKKQ